MFQKANESLKWAPKLSRPPGLTWLRLTICFYCKAGKSQLYLSTSKHIAKQTTRALPVLSPGPFILSNSVISEPSLFKYLHAHRLHIKSMAGWGKFYKMVGVKQGWPGWREDIKQHIKLSSAFFALPGLGCALQNPQLAQENWLLKARAWTYHQNVNQEEA